MKEYNKLVRDRIIEIIESRGQTAEYHIATDEEYRVRSIEKVGEEATEFCQSPTLEELADLQEAIDNAVLVIGSTKAELEQARQQKVAERGNFSKRIILERS